MTAGMLRQVLLSLQMLRLVLSSKVQGRVLRAGTLRLNLQRTRVSLPSRVPGRLLMAERPEPAPTWVRQ